MMSWAAHSLITLGLFWCLLVFRLPLSQFWWFSDVMETSKIHDGSQLIAQRGSWDRQNDT